MEMRLGGRGRAQLALPAPDFMESVAKPFVMSKRVSVSLPFEWRHVVPGGFGFHTVSLPHSCLLLVPFQTSGRSNVSVSAGSKNQACFLGGFFW